ncbi:hypothetical protein GQ457_10G001230 [Hibiscus cannabinus]
MRMKIFDKNESEKCTLRTRFTQLIFLSAKLDTSTIAANTTLPTKILSHKFLSDEVISFARFSGRADIETTEVAEAIGMKDSLHCEKSGYLVSVPELVKPGGSLPRIGPGGTRTKYKIQIPVKTEAGTGS